MADETHSCAAGEDRLYDSDLLEVLAAIEHERWAHWQRYLHSKCTPTPDGSLIIPADQAKRWTQQLNAGYSELPDDQRESDREQVRKYLPEIERFLFGGAVHSPTGEC